MMMMMITMITMITMMITTTDKKICKDFSGTLNFIIYRFALASSNRLRKKSKNQKRRKADSI